MCSVNSLHTFLDILWVRSNLTFSFYILTDGGQITTLRNYLPILESAEYVSIMVLSLLPLSILLAGTKPATDAIFLDFIWDKWRKVIGTFLQLHFLSHETVRAYGRTISFPLQNMKDGRIETPFKVWKTQEPPFNEVTKQFQFDCCFCCPIQNPLQQ